MEKLLKELRNWMTLKNYSESTIRCYVSAVKNFAAYCREHQSDPDYCKAKAPEQYLLYRFKTLGLSWQSINGDYSGIRLFYTQILGRPWDLNKLPRPRKEKYLPRVISRGEVERLLNQASCLKHQVFFLLLYSSGLRLGEALALRPEDIDSHRMQIRVRAGKGNKTRYTLLSEQVLKVLRLYWKEYLPVTWLFNGRVMGEPWSKRGAQHAFVETRRRARLPEHVSAHTLRHCFATHLLENGTDLVSVQLLLGHKHLKTTSRYIHLKAEHFRRIANPADQLQTCQLPTKSATCSGLGESPT